jgi:hypothetical protein
VEQHITDASAGRWVFKATVYKSPGKVFVRYGDGNGGERTIRDRLCQLIRQHQLDPSLVKAYATDSCTYEAVRQKVLRRDGWRCQFVVQSRS